MVDRPGDRGGTLRALWGVPVVHRLCANHGRHGSATSWRQPRTEISTSYLVPPPRYGATPDPALRRSALLLIEAGDDVADMGSVGQGSLRSSGKANRASACRFLRAVLTASPRSGTRGRGRSGGHGPLRCCGGLPSSASTDPRLDDTFQRFAQAARPPLKPPAVVTRARRRSGSPTAGSSPRWELDPPSEARGPDKVASHQLQPTRLSRFSEWTSFSWV